MANIDYYIVPAVIKGIAFDVIPVASRSRVVSFDSSERRKIKVSKNHAYIEKRSKHTR